MVNEIEQELERIVGGEGVSVSELDSAEEANRRVHLETARAAYDLPANRLLVRLKSLPDHIGIEALRTAIEEEFPSSRT